ncbi:hypothetical protein Tco_1194018 [Tanacetum coccineum]
MSTHEQQITNNPTSAVRNTGGRNGPRGLEEPMSDEVLREICNQFPGHYTARDKRNEFLEAENKRVQRELVAAAAKRRMVRYLDSIWGLALQRLVHISLHCFFGLLQQ